MTATSDGARFRHGVLVVDADDTIERLLVPQLRHRITAGQAVMMVVGDSTARIVRDELAGEAEALRWTSPDEFYRRLGSTYRNFDRYLHERHTRRDMVHLVAEPGLVSDPSTPVDRPRAYLDYEAMANERFARYGCPVTCVWHRRRHPPSLIDGLRRVHSHELTPTGYRESPGYLPPVDYLGTRVPITMTPVAPRTDIDLTVTEPNETPACRAAVARWAAGRHFVPTAVRQVVLACSEVVSNGLRHGRPPVRVRGWSEDGTLIVHVEDHGGRRIPEVAGYRPPRTPADSGGLWVARQIADVLLTSTGGGRTAVRMYFPHAVMHRDL